MDDKDKYLYFDTKPLAQAYVRMKQEEKEKKETMKNDKFKYSYFVYNGLRYPVEVISENLEETPWNKIHTLDISVNLNTTLDDVASLYPKNMYAKALLKYCNADVESTLELCKRTIAVKQPKIKNVIFNYPATIVFWEDGTKTVVQARGDDPYDREKGLAMAMCKKFLGNQGNYYEEFKKWLPDKEIEIWRPAHELVKYDLVDKCNEAKAEEYEENRSRFVECADNRYKAIKIRDSLDMRKRPRGR